MMARLALLLFHVASAATLPGIPWHDSRGMVPPHHFPIPAQTFILLVPTNCPDSERQGMVDFWNQLDAVYPHYVWSADCSDKGAAQLCQHAVSKRWLDASGPQLLVWKKKKTGKKSAKKGTENEEGGWRTSFFPFRGEKSPQAFATSVQSAHKKYLSSVTRAHEDGKMRLTRALANRGDKREGRIMMLSNQLPVWFNCTDYGLRPSDTDGFSLQAHLAASVVQDFFPPLNSQRQYSGDAWSLRWRVISVAPPSFQWTDAAADDVDDDGDDGGGDNGDGDNGDGGRKTTTWRNVRVLEPREGGTEGAYRTCSLAWGEKDAYEADSGGLAEQSASPAAARLQIEIDTGQAYDWLRFRFLEFAEIVASRRLKMQPHQQSRRRPLVVYDPVAGTCWFPLLVRAALQSSGVKVHTICSDISADAINIARRDFGANSAVGVNSSTFMVGDLFEPLKRAQEEASSSEEEELLRPHVVYYLPPQASNQGELRPTSFATAWMYPRTLLWHSVHLC